VGELGRQVAHESCCRLVRQVPPAGIELRPVHTRGSKGSVPPSSCSSVDVDGRGSGRWIASRQVGVLFSPGGEEGQVVGEAPLGERARAARVGALLTGAAGAVLP
jgi:hypothetical protein